MSKARPSFGDVGQAVAVGGDHGDRLRLQDQQRAVEGVARLLVGDGEDGFGDQGAEGLRGNFDHAAGGEDRHAGKLERAMPTILVMERPARMLTQWFSSSLMLTSPSPSSFT